jgi:peptide/nickel transport system permease protein
VKARLRALLPMLLLALLLLGWWGGGDGTVNLSDRLQGPSRAHLLGTDEVGRDLTARFWLGGARSLTLGLVLTLLHLASGLLMAGLAQAAGSLRRAVLALADLLASIPGLLLALLLVAMAPPGYGSLVVALAIGGWIPYTRISLTQLDALREDSSLLQARIQGAGRLHRLRVHLLPRMAPVLLAQSAVGLGAVILVEGGLSFLGVGLPPDRASWGTMLASGRTFLLASPWGLLWPSLGLLVVLLSLNSLQRGPRAF